MYSVSTGGATAYDDDPILLERYAGTFEEFVLCDNVFLTAFPQSDVAGMCEDLLN